MSKQSEMSKFMKKQAALEKKRKEMLEVQDEKDAPKKEEEKGQKPESAKVTKLVFFKKYDTYQALLEVFPSEKLSVKGLKIIKMGTAKYQCAVFTEVVLGELLP